MEIKKEMIANKQEKERMKNHFTMSLMFSSFMSIIIGGLLASESNLILGIGTGIVMFFVLSIVFIGMYGGPDY